MIFLAINVILSELSRKFIKLTTWATTSCYSSSSTFNSELSNYSLYSVNPSNNTDTLTAKCQDGDDATEQTISSILVHNDLTVSTNYLINNSIDINCVLNKPLTHLTQEEKSFNNDDASD